ncbi:MAG: hypothetical protein U1F56_25725 [Rubrivivax sp.]
MVWSSQNLSFPGSPNYAAYAAPNYAAYAAPNYAAYAAPNYAAYAAPNDAAYAAPNAAPPALALAAGPGRAVAGSTGAGGASGSGFAGGYGPVARFEYATPAALAPIPWSLDFAAGDGWPSFPFENQLDPDRVPPWQPGDWDPGLRFWTLPFDPHLTEWLQDLNLGAPAVMAAREFAVHHDQWLAQPAPRTVLQTRFEEGLGLLGWRDGSRGRTAAETVRAEISGLIDLMRDDRARYLDELLLQSGQAVPYFVHLMRFDPADKPWTMELMNCASSIANLVKMQYKSHYRRVRPSTLCPGLVPPWGPPRHPAFPSGHSTVAHLTALLLLSIDGVAERYGIFGAQPGIGRAPSADEMLASAYGTDQHSSLLWLAWRIAKGRERLGLHYESDSAAGRRLATLVWQACVPEQDDRAPAFDVPTLRHVLHRARSEWPSLASGAAARR